MADFPCLQAPKAGTQTGHTEGQITVVFIRKKHNHFQAKVRVPTSQREAHGGREFVYLTLPTSDSKAAKAEAMAWEAELRREWLAPTPSAPQPSSAEPTPAQLRAAYHELRERAEAGAFTLDTLGEDPVEAGIDWEIGKIADRYEGEEELPELEEYRLAALNDARMQVQGVPVPRRKAVEAPFRELADDYMVTWKAKHGLKETNTEQQMLATFDLFKGFFGSRPIRDVRDPDAAHFVDALRQLDPHWARKPEARSISWKALMREYGGRPKGLADSTVNRHMATLKTFWNWAKRRGHCDGENPFEGHHRTLKEGVNAKGYVAWTDEELRHLFSPPPKNSDLTEVMLIALYSGMRLDEIASLTVGDIHKEAVPFMRVHDAKTRAGNRDVPIHPSLLWLIEKAQGDGSARLWPNFKGTGPGNKPGADAGKEFSRHKARKGYRERVKAFHSFRKNFVGQLERHRVPEQEVAQIVGHEKSGFTFGTYGGEAELKRKAEVVALISYPDLPVPEAYQRNSGRDAPAA